MKSFCISMEKRKATWPDLRVMFEKNGIDDIVIFPAVDGAKIKSQYFDKNNNENGNFNPKTDITSWALYHLVKNTNRRDHVQLGTWGAVGCYLSHATLWQKIVDENLDMAMIFEDDVSFSDSFSKGKNKILNALPNDADIIFFDLIKNFEPERYNDIFDRVNGQFFGTHAYIMTNKAAKKLLPVILPVEIQIDALISLRNYLDNLKLYTATGLCWQSFHPSSVQQLCYICDLQEKDFYIFDIVLKLLIGFLLITFIVFLIYKLCLRATTV